MKRFVGILVLLLVILTLSACASAPEWKYEKNAVRLHLIGDPKLNLYKGTPHTLVLCVYYLRDPNAFNQLVDEEDGLSKLLDCSRFDTSVASTKRVVVQPGQELNESLDRAEGAKFVGIAAGYYYLAKDKSTRLYPIPVSGFSKSPEVLNVDLYLAPQEIQGGKAK